MFGKTVPALIEHPLEESCIHIGKNTVAYEARKLLSLIYEVTCWKEWHCYCRCDTTNWKNKLVFCSVQWGHRLITLKNVLLVAYNFTWDFIWRYSQFIASVCSLGKPPSDTFTFVFNRLNVNFQENKYFILEIRNVLFFYVTMNLFRL